jgi:transcriptional regulator with XRE-family HTH domain
MSEDLPDQEEVLFYELLELRWEMGERLLNLRLERGWKQSEVAEHLWITPFRLSNYELGKSSVPYDLLMMFCDLYGVTSDYLLGRTPAE